MVGEEERDVGEEGERYKYPLSSTDTSVVVVPWLKCGTAMTYVTIEVWGVFIPFPFLPNVSLFFQPV